MSNRVWFSMVENKDTNFVGHDIVCYGRIQRTSCVLPSVFFAQPYEPVESSVIFQILLTSWANRCLSVLIPKTVVHAGSCGVCGRAVKALRSGRSQLCWRGFDPHRTHIFLQKFDPRLEYVFGGTIVVHVVIRPVFCPLRKREREDLIFFHRAFGHTVFGWCSWLSRHWRSRVRLSARISLLLTLLRSRPQTSVQHLCLAEQVL